MQSMAVLAQRVGQTPASDLEKESEVMDWSAEGHYKQRRRQHKQEADTDAQGGK